MTINKMNKKPCPVCIYLKVYSEKFVLELNNLIFSNSKYKNILELLETSKVLNDKEKPSKHYIEKHRVDCLLNFKIPIEEQISENEINTKIEEYRKQTIEDKQNYKLKLLDEIEFLIISTVHHELINGRLCKGFIPKDDISSLKIINDVMKGKPDNEDKDERKGTIEEMTRLVKEEWNKIH